MRFKKNTRRKLDDHHTAIPHTKQNEIHRILQTTAVIDSSSFHDRPTTTQPKHPSQKGAPTTMCFPAREQKVCWGNTFKGPTHQPQTILNARFSPPHLGRLELGGLVLGHAPLSLSCCSVRCDRSFFFSRGAPCLN